MLEIQKLIIENTNWEELLQKEPYYLKIKRDNGLIIFNYTLGKSNFNYNICHEARGLILEEDSWQIVRFAMKKFFNYGESFAAKIDWNSAKIQEKIDGSLFSLYYYKDMWRLATNGMINAFAAPLENGIYKTFGDLFMEALRNTHLNFNELNKNHCYTFELVSPCNQIVLNYSTFKLYHISTRNLITLEEIEETISIDKPQSYSFKNLEETIDWLKNQSKLMEGFVVVDNNYNRIKIKTEEYVRRHHIRTNGILTKKRAIELIRENELEEFLSYFPHHEEFIWEIKQEITKLYYVLAAEVNLAYCNLGLNRKDFAEKATDEYRWLWFLVYNNKWKNISNWFEKAKTKEIVRELAKVSNLDFFAEM